MVVLDVAVWGAWSAVVGYWGHRRPPQAFAGNRRLYRLRRWERGGRFYEERLRIKDWKDRLPDAGAFFAGGMSKRALPGKGIEALSRFEIETRRAEWAHWVIMLAVPVFVIWNYWWVVPVMAGYAVAANGPCVAVQRYNRARLEHLLDRSRPG
ncbi:MAG: hypothetical protein ACT4PW_01215 [Acidimicrobiia bacterium]